MSVRRFAALVALIVVLAACNGPGIPLNVGVREFPTDILLGAQADGKPIDHVPLPIPVPLPRVRTHPTKRPTPPPDPCPPAHPFATPTRELRGGGILPPRAASYPFALSGSITSGPASATLPSEIERTVENVATGAGGSFTFDVTSSLTRTSFRVLPEASGLDQAGIYMTKQVLGPPGQQVTLTPSPAVKLLPFPVENGARWDSVSTDLATGTSWVIRGSVGVMGPDPSDPSQQVLNPTLRVDACGRWIDGWAVRITGPDGGPARIISPTMNLAFTATYAFAPHYGSLAVLDDTALDGTISSIPFTSRSIASIKREPLVPGGAAR